MSLGVWTTSLSSATAVMLVAIAVVLLITADCPAAVTLRAAPAKIRTVDAEMTALAQSLWQLDVNRCRTPVMYAISKQGQVSSSVNVTSDLAPTKLFSTFNENTILTKSTYSKFVALLDNYEASTSLAEIVTSQEKAENSAFLDAIMSTSVMREVHRFLVSKGKASANTAVFKQQLSDTWFTIFKRKTQDKYNNSCAFEHIFVGETESNDVSGMHSWLAFYLHEKAGRINYLGHHYRPPATGSLQQLILTARFAMHGGRFLKPTGSFFLGTSPEFEVALYTASFLMSTGTRIPIAINGTAVDMIVHRIGNNIGTVYPSQP